MAIDDQKIGMHKKKTVPLFLLLTDTVSQPKKIGTVWFVEYGCSDPWPHQKHFL